MVEQSAVVPPSLPQEELLPGLHMVEGRYITARPVQTQKKRDP